MRFLQLALLSCLSLFGACAVGPDYSPPEFSFLPTFASQTVATLPQDDIENRAPQSKWWESFNDSALNDLIAHALQNNRNIDAALARINQARALAQESYFNLFPGAQAQAGYIKNKTAGERFGAVVRENITFELFSAGFDALWEIDIFGRQRRRYQAQTAAMEAEIAGLQDVQRMVIAEVARHYFQLRGAQSRRTVAEENVGAEREVLQLAQSKLESGEGTALDSARASAALFATQATIPPLIAAENSAKYRLAILCGVQPGTLDGRLSKLAPAPRYLGPITLGEPRELLRRRPDVRQVERRLAQRTAEVGFAVGELFPKVEFSGSFAYEAPSFGDLGSSGTDSYNFGPRISWPALSLNRVFARVDAADARAVEALNNYQQIVLNALEETENALLIFSTERMRFQLLTQAQKESKRALDLSTVQFESGAIDFLTVLQAQQTWLKNRDDLARSELELNTALVAVYKALGGGWEDFPLSEAKN